MLTISVEAICYKVRPLRDNTCPLMLRLTQHRKRKYISLGVFVLGKDWDFKKCLSAVQKFTHEIQPYSRHSVQRHRLPVVGEIREMAEKQEYQGHDYKHSVPYSPKCIQPCPLHETYKITYFRYWTGRYIERKCNGRTESTRSFVK